MSLWHTALLITASRRWSVVREVFGAGTSLLPTFHSPELSTWDHAPCAQEEVKMGSVNSQSVSAIRSQGSNIQPLEMSAWSISTALSRLRHLSSICCFSYTSNVQSTSLKNLGPWKSRQPIQQNPGQSALGQISSQSIPFLSLIPLMHAWLHLPGSRSSFWFQFQ